MNKYILFFIYLISISLCGYLPLKKSNGFDDNVCAYTFSSVNYVKTCKEGQFCKSIDGGTSICEDIPNTITLKTLGDDCKHKFECEKGLYCYGGKCTIYDSAIGCSANEEVHRVKNGWECKIKEIADYCKYDINNVNFITPVDYTPDYSKVCGEITFKTDSLGTNQGTEYTVSTIKSAYIGTVPDGKFVLNPKACKSGYALPFYPDDSLKDPSYDRRNKMYLKCVSINDVDYESYGGCTFKYDTDKIYYTNHYDNSKIYIYSEDINGNPFRYTNLCPNNLKTKLEMFSKYIGVFTEDKQKDCAKKENYNEPETCNDNELRKWKYYYENPEHYILYYDEKGNDVANYLIQQEYPLYQSSKILNIKYFISLLLLLLF